MDPAEGNPEVIALLERCLAQARLGVTSYAVVVLCEAGKMSAGFNGDRGMQEAAKKAIRIAYKSLAAEIRNATPPPPDPELGADYACFKVPGNTMSYDFVAWLVDREMTRRLCGAPAPLKVAFWMGRDGKAGGLDKSGRRRMLENVARPALALLGAVEDARALNAAAKDISGLRDIVTAARAGAAVPSFTPSEKARSFVKEFIGRSKPPVTITLREMDQWPSRNSNVPVWTAFADYLVDRYGENVVFVRDTAKAWLPIAGHETCPLASLNIDNRTALYEAAKANLFTSNGPAILAFLGDKPWLTFVVLNEDGHPYYPNTPKYWRENMAMEPGDQLPWSRPDQRIIYAPDSYENLVAAWETHLANRVR